MQCACGMLSSVVCPAPQYFLHCPIHGTIFGKKKLLKIKKCVSSFSTTFSETFFILRIERDIIENAIGFHVKYPYSCPILMKLEFSKQILEKYLNIN